MRHTIMAEGSEAFATFFGALLRDDEPFEASSVTDSVEAVSVVDIGAGATTTATEGAGSGTESATGWGSINVVNVDTPVFSNRVGTR